MGEESASVQVERRVAEAHADPSSATELIRSMALSSAELWHDVLQRLCELQESQVVLAQAVAELGSMVRGSIAAVTPPAVAAPYTTSALEAGTVSAEPEVTLPASVDPGPIPDAFDAGAFGFATDPVGELPEDLVAAFYPPDAEIVPWYKRKLSLSLRRRKAVTREAESFSAPDDWPPLPPPPQVLPPPPPTHLLDSYVFDATAATPSAPEVLSTPAARVIASSPGPEPVAMPEPVVVPEPEVVAEDVVASDTFTAPEPVAPSVAPLAAEPLAPQPLVYTPSNAETALPFELDEPAAPVAIPFELDPPQGFAAHDTSVAVPVQAMPPVPPVASVPPVPLEMTPPAPVAPDLVAAPAPLADLAAPVAPLAAPVAPAAEEPAVVGALAGRPVVEAQMSVSMATEILGSAAAAVPPPPRASGEPAPLVISEDLTLVSKNHRKRRQFRFR